MADVISKEQVQSIAKLGNLSLDEAEVGKYSKQLSEVIDFNIKQLSKVDTDGVEPLLNVSGLTNSFREDRPEPGLTNAETLQNTEGKHNGLFKVKAVLDQ